MGYLEGFCQSIHTNASMRLFVRFKGHCSEGYFNPALQIQMEDIMFPVELLHRNNCLGVPVFIELLHGDRIGSEADAHRKRLVMRNGSLGRLRRHV